uniref:hypothetical protein n=1 Tax=Neisseria sicca TaxID=490 RepID=UPI001C99CB72
NMGDKGLGVDSEGGDLKGGMIGDFERVGDMDGRGGVKMKFEGDLKGDWLVGRRRGGAFW